MRRLCDLNSPKKTSYVDHRRVASCKGFIKNSYILFGTTHTLFRTSDTKFEYLGHCFMKPYNNHTVIAMSPRGVSQDHAVNLALKAPAPCLLVGLATFLLLTMLQDYLSQRSFSLSALYRHLKNDRVSSCPKYLSTVFINLILQYKPV